jgi:hypothetical protein
MDDTVELPYPEWQLPLQEAILEFDPNKLAEKAQKAVGVILERLLELQQSNNGHNERAAILDGLSILRTIKCDRLNYLAGSRQPRRTTIILSPVQPSALRQSVLHYGLRRSASAPRHTTSERCLPQAQLVCHRLVRAFVLLLQRARSLLQ